MGSCCSLARSGEEDDNEDVVGTRGGAGASKCISAPFGSLVVIEMGVADSELDTTIEEDVGDTWLVSSSMVSVAAMLLKLVPVVLVGGISMEYTLSFGELDVVGREMVNGILDGTCCCCSVDDVSSDARVRRPNEIRQLRKNRWIVRR